MPLDDTSLRLDAPDQPTVVPDAAPLSPRPSVSLDAVRAKYPQYNDLSDAALVKGLHGKFYSDLPFDDFAQRVGFAPSRAEGIGAVDDFGRPVETPPVAPEKPLPRGYMGDGQPYQGGMDFNLPGGQRTFTPGAVQVRGQGLLGAIGAKAAGDLETGTAQAVAAGPRLVQGSIATARVAPARQLAVMDQIDAGKPVAPMDDPLGYADQSPEQRQRTRADFIAAAATRQQPGPIEAGAGRMADTMVGTAGAYAAQHHPVDPEQAERPVVKLAGMAAGMAPLVVATAVGGLPAAMGTAFAQSYETTFEDATAHGAAPDQAHLAALKNGAVQGGLMAVPAAQWLGGLTPKVANAVLSAGIGAAVHGGTMLGVSQVQTLASNIFAQGYDPTRPVGEHLGDDMLEQFALGVLLPVAHQIPGTASRLAERYSRPGADPALAANVATQQAALSSAQSSAASGQQQAGATAATPPPAPPPAPAASPMTGDPHQVLANIATHGTADAPLPVPPAPAPPVAAPPAASVESPPPAAPPQESTLPPPTRIRTVAQIQQEDGVSTPKAQQIQNEEILAIGRPVSAEDVASRAAGVSGTPGRQAPVARQEPQPARSGSYVMVDPGQLNVDPKRFQYKEADDKGVTGALAGTDRWEPGLANPITAWQGDDGKLYVVNGHQRTDLANRAQAAGQPDVQVPARVYREADGYTPEYMRTLGAYQNIAEGSGTALDAAKVLRGAQSIPDSMRLPDLPPRGQMVRQGMALAKLSPEAFGAVEHGVVPEAYAAHVGNLLSDPTEQLAALDMLSRAQPANTEQARMMVEDIRNSGFLKGAQTTLFGDEDFARSLVPERARVLDNAMRTLRRVKGVFRAAVEGEDTLTSAGNQLSREGNVRAKTDNERLIDAIQRNATARGPLSDALSDAARDLAGGKSVPAVVSQFLGKARGLVRSGQSEGVQSGAPDGGAGHPGEAEPPVEGQSGFFARRPVADLTGQELPQAGTPGRRQAIRDWAIRTLRGQVVHSNALGADVRINRRGLEKVLSHANDAETSVLPAIPLLIQHGQRIGLPEPSHSAQERQGGIRAYHRLGGDITVGGVPHSASIVVREAFDGHFFYDLSAAMNVVPKREALPPGPAHGTPGSTTSTSGLHPDETIPESDRQSKIGDEEPPVQFARRLPAPPKEGEDLFGAVAPAPGTVAPEPTIRNDPAQGVMPGMEPSARQAQAARDQAGPRAGQVRANEGLFAPKEAENRTLFARREAEGAKAPLYSPVSRAVDALKQLKGTGEQMLAQISRTPGVKPEEIKWLGLEDWLKGQKGVTKAQIQDYVRANALDVREVTKGDPIEAPDIAAKRSRFQELIDRDEGRGSPLTAAEDAEATRLSAELNEHPNPWLSPNTETRYGQYTLPGGKDYREMLVTLPTKPRATSQINRAMIAKYGDLSTAFERMTPVENAEYNRVHGREALVDHLTDWAREQPKLVAHLLEPGGIEQARQFNANMRETLKGHSDDDIISAVREAQNPDPRAVTPHQSAHWDEPNVLAHMRFSERTSPDGAKVLHIEELQSDWHQAGRKQGYKDGAAKPLDELYDVKRHVVNGETVWSAYDRETGQLAGRGASLPEMEKEVREAMTFEDTPIARLNAVPDAPFKTTWPMLAMKRMVQYAVDHGFDRVAWNPGDVQAARYDLSKHLDRIEYEPSDEAGKYEIAAYDKAGKEVIHEDEVGLDRIEQMVGKELAQKIADDVGEPMKDRPLRDWRSLSGLDLKVGGEGMKGFYDKMLPNEVQKLIGKFGARVGQGEIEHPAPDYGDGERRDAMRQPVHSFDITDQLRRAVQEDGLPLFAKRIPSEAEAARIAAIPGELPQAAKAARERFYQAASAMMRFAGLPESVGLKLVDKITEANADAKYARGLITFGLDTDAEKAPFKIWHETLHALMSPTLGLLSPKERLAMFAGADRWLKADPKRAESLKADGYGGNELRDEAVAKMAEQALARGLQPNTVIGTAIGKLRNVGRGLGQFFRGEGWTTAEDVFNGLMRGDRAQPGAREAMRAADMAQAAQSRPSAGPISAAQAPAQKPEDPTEPVASPEVQKTTANAQDYTVAGTTITLPDRYFSRRTPVALQNAAPTSVIARTAIKVDDWREKMSDAISHTLSPMTMGSKQAQAYAFRFANALRSIQYQFGQIDRHIVKQFDPAARDAMGRAMDDQSVLEQQINQLRKQNAAPAQGTIGQTTPPQTPMTAVQLAGTELQMRQALEVQGRGVASLPADQRRVVEDLAAMAETVWGRMRSRGLVPPGAEGLPFYMARQIVMRDPDNTITRPGSGAGRDINEIGRNLSTAGPQRRQHLTPEETEAAAKIKLGQSAELIRDIRSVVQRLASNERSIAGTDLINQIERVGQAAGVSLVVRGAIPGLLNPADYFTINHPSMQRYVGAGFEALHIAREFEGPLNAVLTTKTGDLYNALMKAKGGVMHAIMFSPFMHLAVELGRALPLMPGKILSGRVMVSGARLKADPAFMNTAIREGLSPIGQGWSLDPVRVAEEADTSGRSGFVSAMIAARDKAAEAVSKLATPFGQKAVDWTADALKHPSQTILWDQVFNLQVGLYSEMRSRFMAKGFAPDVAGVMASHIANRYAGALPPENLSKLTNQAANMLAFSRSFTLGNLGVMKDMLNGAPQHIRATIEQMASPAVAGQAQAALQRKAQAAFILDIGFSVLGTALFQQMAAIAIRAPAMGLPAAAQQVWDDWLDQTKASFSQINENPLNVLGFLPQFHNEPGKKNRIYVGNDSAGRGTYVRPAFGKVGEEFLGWYTHPGEMVMNKMSPFARPVVEAIFGEDSLGRKITKPNPTTAGDYMKNAGRVVMHFLGAQGPWDHLGGTWDLLTGQSKGDRGVAAVKALLPFTGLGTMSSGYPGGPDNGRIAAAKKDVAFETQRTIPQAAKLAQSGDVPGAMKLLTDAGDDPREAARMAMFLANPAVGQASAARWAARHPGAMAP